MTEDRMQKECRFCQGTYLSRSERTVCLSCYGTGWTLTEEEQKLANMMERIVEAHIRVLRQELHDASSNSWD